jgi:hypothetical protein
MKQLIAVVFCLLALPAFGATCKLNEYANMVVDDMGRVTPVAEEPRTAAQEVTFTTTTQSAVFNPSTRFVAIVCDAKAHYLVGTDPTALTTGFFIPANTIWVIGIKVTPSASAATYKIAFVVGS